jgi:hypothetical protein
LFVHLVVRHRLGESGVDLVELFQQIDDLLRAFLDDVADGLRFVQLRLLFEIAD